MRVFVPVVLLFVVITFATSYEDTQFLNHLHDELEDYLIDESVVPKPLHSRYRRDAEDDHLVISDDHLKCKQQSKKSCCGKTNLFKRFADPDKTLGKACYTEISDLLKPEIQQLEPSSLFSCDKYRITKKLQFCALECIGKKKKLLTANGTIIEEAMKKYLHTELFKEAWQKEIAEMIVPKCMNEKYAEWPENEHGVRCNPLMLQLQHCLWKEYEMNCPITQQKDSKKCNKLRNQLKELVTKQKIR